ncbi:MAG TPA: hypothetical protein VJC20_01175 [Candidatus Paceibacterota bacterium]
MREGTLYSAPQEKKKQAEKKISEVELFIEAIEQALANQQQLLHALQINDSLPEREKRNRIEGTQKTIQAVLDRVADERKKKDLLGANIVRLKKIHAIGLRILQSTKANYDTAH